MKLTCKVLIFAGFLLYYSVPAEAQSSQTIAGNTGYGQLVIATANTSPISVDRFLYVAFKNLNYSVDVACQAISEGHTTANNGTNDGVISAYPNLENEYKNLLKVPVILDYLNVSVFVREGSGIFIKNWNELSGLHVGIQENQPYSLQKLPENVKITTRPTNRALLDGVYSGEYDVAILAERSHDPFSAGNRVVRAGQVDRFDEYLYLNKKYQELIPHLTGMLEAMFLNGSAQKILSGVHLPEISPRKTILHIISRNSELEREDKFSGALKQRFADDISIEWRTVNLDAMNSTRDRQRMSRIAHLIRTDCVSRNVNALIVSGNAALIFLMYYYYLCFRNVPVLFYGAGGQYKEIINGYGQNFSGIVDNLEAYQSVKAALELFPGTKNIYVVNDYKTEGMRYRQEIQEQLKPLEDSLHIEYNNDISCEAVLARIKGLPKDSLVFVGSYFNDANDQFYSLGEMKRLLERDSRVPIVSLYSTDVAYNAIGGKCLDYGKYGDEIAEMLENLLEGAEIRNIPLVSGSQDLSRWAFDQIQMNNFNIKKNALPAGSMIINGVPSIWKSNPQYAISLFFLVFACILIFVGINIYTIKTRKQKLLYAEEANRAKSVFLSNMSHEMRTPLNVVVGLTNLMLEDTDMPSKDRENLKKIGIAGNTIIALINDVLDISKIEAGKLDLLPAHYDVASMINDIIVINMIRVEDKPITFHLDITNDIPHSLYGDDLRIRQILNNILSNAFKYTQKGDVTLGLSSSREEGTDNVWLSAYVSDTGVGIRKEDIAKLFTDYSQVDTRTNRNVQGTGLGLSITKKLVDLMNGEITVESEYGKGTTFRLRILQGIVTDKTIGEEVANSLRDFCYKDSTKRVREKLIRPDLSYAKVMIVDDMPTNLDVAAGMLRKYKMQVDCVTNGKEAVERIGDKKEIYNAIFMDHMMPEMDGMEATKKIRALGTEYAEKIPIIALTANAIAGNEKMFLENGFDAFLPKPINMMALDSVVQNLIRDKSKE
jgi:signal transduction histidine kinase/CheY-like chemotaxis protein